MHYIRISQWQTNNIIVHIILSLPAPVTVTDCASNQNTDCAVNTDGNTVCFNNVCSCKYLKSIAQKKTD